MTKPNEPLHLGRLFAAFWAAVAALLVPVAVFAGGLEPILGWSMGGVLALPVVLLTWNAEVG